MEGIRQRATRQAKAVRDRKTAKLKFYLSELPETMTKEELCTLIVQDYCSQTGVKPSAFFRHVKRHALLSYDGTTGRWVNLSK